MYKSQPYQSIGDIALEKTGTYESVYEIALANNVSVTNEPVVGSEFVVDSNAFDKEVVVIYESESTHVASLYTPEYSFENTLFNYRSIDLKNSQENLVLFEPGQTMIDAVTQKYGTLEALFDFSLANDYGIDILPATASILKAPLVTVNSAVVSQFGKNNIIVATLTGEPEIIGEIPEELLASYLPINLV